MHVTEDAGSLDRDWFLFDFAGVLGHHQTSQVRDLMSEIVGVDEADLTAAYWRHRQPYDAGLNSATVYWKRIIFDLGASVSDTAIEKLVRIDTESWLQPNHDTLTVVANLAESGAQLAILSNAPCELAAGIESRPWLAAFSQKIFSCRLRLAKPDPDSYKMALDTLGTEPRRVTFIDDRG